MAFTISTQKPKMVDGCMPVECPKCGKTTWKGCGQHVDQVMAGIPEENRCACPRN